MLLHIRPRFFSSYQYVELIDLDIEPFGTPNSTRMLGSMLRRFGAVAAYRHCAPTPPVALADIQKPQCALRTLAMANVGKVGIHQKIRHREGNGLQHRIRIPPILPLIQNQGCTRRNLKMRLPAQQHIVQGTQGACDGGLEGFTGVLLDDPSKPFA